MIKRYSLYMLGVITFALCGFMCFTTMILERSFDFTSILAMLLSLDGVVFFGEKLG